jgi:FkbM family methyltransferase
VPNPADEGPGGRHRQAERRQSRERRVQGVVHGLHRPAARRAAFGGPPEARASARKRRRTPSPPGRGAAKAHSAAERTQRPLSLSFPILWRSADGVWHIAAHLRLRTGVSAVAPQAPPKALFGVRSMDLRSTILTLLRFAGPLLTPSRAAAVYRWRLIMQVLRSSEIETVIDIGANIGQFARSMRQIGFLGRIISFEPISDVFANLERRMRDDMRWVGLNCALGEVEEFRLINRMRATDFSSFRHPTTKATQQWRQENTVIAQESVRVRRFDSLATELPKLGRTLVKSDTQGFEMEVFKGFGDMLWAVNVILAEVSAVPLYDDAPTMLEVLAFLQGFGFRYAGFFPVTSLPDQSAIDFDALLINSVQKSSLTGK